MVSFNPVQVGINLVIMEKVTPPKSANKAAFDVVRFQKKPMVNKAKIPGDTYPVYS